MVMKVFLFVPTGGYEQRDSAAPHFLTSEYGVTLSLHHYGWVPQPYHVPASLEAARPRLAEQLAHAGGGLIESEAVVVNRLPAVRQVLRVSSSETPGRVVFVGSYVIPRASCSAMVQLEAAEEPVTGARELAVLDALGFEHCFRPHPYAPDLDDGRGFNAAYAPEWDPLFPDHPLTLVRSEMDRIIERVVLDPEFCAVPPVPEP
jgi:hypothetical protein